MKALVSRNLLGTNALINPIYAFSFYSPAPAILPCFPASPRSPLLKVYSPQNQKDHKPSVLCRFAVFIYVQGQPPSSSFLSKKAISSILSSSIFSSFFLFFLLNFSSFFSLEFRKRVL